jgi:hypothetical protein
VAYGVSVRRPRGEDRAHVNKLPWVVRFVAIALALLIHSAAGAQQVPGVSPAQRSQVFISLGYETVSGRSANEFSWSSAFDREWTTALGESASPASIAVPPVVGRTVADARNSLRVAGLVLRILDPLEDETQAVIEDQTPAAGTWVPPGSEVRVQVRASGHGVLPVGDVRVPLLTGLQLAGAEYALALERLELGEVRTTTSHQGVGVVVDQAPEAGTRVPPGARVSIVVTGGAPPQPGAAPLSPKAPPPLAVPQSRYADRPPATPPGGTLDAVDRILASLELANMVFNAPRTLQLREVLVIQLLLSTAQSVEELQGMITAAGEREGARVRISNQMEARLSGRGFKIEAITPEVQAVGASELTEWKWIVEPTQAGPQLLHLSLSAHLHVEGQRVPRVIRTFEQSIEVHVTWPQRVTAFVASNWQWLWTAILVPVIGWAIRKRMQSKTVSTGDC